MVEIEWTAREIRCLRDALRLSKPEFARRVRVTTRTLRLWESGETTRPHAASRRLLYRVLEEADADAVVRFRTSLDSERRTPAVMDAPGAGTAHGLYAWEVSDEDMKRRVFGKVAATGAAVALFGGGSGRVGMTDVQRLLAAIGELEEKDQRFGSGMFVDQAIRELAVAKNVLDECSYDGATGDALASATGELAVLTGWLAFDSDRQQLARRCYADAMALGTEADDDELVAHTCLYAANQSIRLSRNGVAGPHRALHLVGRARELMRGHRPGRIHVLIALREAQTCAILRDRPAFDRAIATAHREMDYAASFEPIEEAPVWLRSVNYSEVAHHEARGLSDFSEFDRAIALLDKAIGEQIHERNATMSRASSAFYRLQTGDLEGALEESRSVLRALNSLSSVRTLRELRPIRAAAAGRPAAADWCEEFDTLNRKGALS
ncbi:helix-turn-helix domain-containing protein [Nocardia wallacei]|uniref:helix-turn-helix domain-containing protein n=1 Tax=Nocardia wallacei TaxID=480035 RepID=UPI002457FDBA|nr:hypothetical protein [Nocardia wallacei]